MYTLIIDSATKVLYISLVNDNSVIEELYIQGENNHSEKILTLINDTLSKHNLIAKDLNKVIVGYGPGSYTGVRLGVVIGKILAAFSDIKLYYISTLLLMTSGQTVPSIAVIDARKNNVYAGGYLNHKNVYTETFINFDELKEAINDEYKIIDEKNFKVDPLKVISYAKEIKNVHGFEPNYIKEVHIEESKK